MTKTINPPPPQPNDEFIRRLQYKMNVIALVADEIWIRSGGHPDYARVIRPGALLK